MLREHPVEKYTEKIQMDKIKATQSKIEEAKVELLSRKNKFYKLPEVIKYRGLYYIWDGHHRVESLFRKHIRDLFATVFDLDLALSAK